MSHLPPQGFTNLQLELLKMFAYQLPEEELVELKLLLSNFFGQRIQKRAAMIWKEKGYTNDTMQNWLNEDRQ